MRGIALAVLCLLFQDPDLGKSVARLAERLSDDKIEIRDSARRDLVALGSTALPVIRRLAESSELEVRERLYEVVREIERLERLKFFLREPQRIRLKADRRPIGELLKDLAKQSETPVKLKDVPPEEPVTVEIQDRPFFEALQEICLAHGGLVFLLPGGPYTLENHEPVELVRGDPKACRRFVHGPFVVTLESLHISGSTLGPKQAQPQASLTLKPGWERGIRPVRMKLQVTSVVDEAGTSYPIPSRPFREPMDVYIYRSEWVSLGSVPPPSVTSFREIAGTVEFEFPSDGYVSRIEQPLGRKEVESSGGPASFTLEEMARESDRVRVALISGWSSNEEYVSRTRYFAIDTLDRIYPQEGGHGKGTAAGKMRWSFSFDVPADAEVKELRAVKLKLEKDRTKIVTIPWKLENVKFR